jgi:hypothetical protein
MEDTSTWLTPSQAARAIGISVEYTRILMRTGRLAHVETPLGRLVSPDGVEDARARGVGHLRKHAAHD